MAKKPPMRMCIGCGERKTKGELIRVVYNKKDNKIMVDLRGKMPGRGAYLCPDQECLLRARKKDSLARALKTVISDQIYDQLMEEIDIMKD
jgi:uncharacterized protein